MEHVDIDGLRAATARQGAKVRELKKNGGKSEDIQAAVEELQELKIQLEKLSLKENEDDKFNKKALDDLLIRKMYVVPSFEIYGGIGGFYDFGPPACTLKANVLSIWRNHFLLNDSMLEIECTNLMPHIVLETSGHVEKFTDLMVKDEKTGECYRADKMLEDHIENLLKVNPTISAEEAEVHRLNAVKAGTFSPQEIHDVFQSYGIKSHTGNTLSFPVPFNLMFQCQIGPEGNQIGYLRPETAQGIFLNFRRLLDYNAGKFPFGTAQIGCAFRNEISPRGGLLRVREFQQAEIEYFVNPNDKSHPKFASLKDTKLVLFPKGKQLSDGKTVVMTVGDAVSQRIIANESLGYFLAKTSSFCERIGVDPARVRFRQHLDTEMAHYACDCWDLEIKLSAGWIECAGHADRSCYDLQVHAKRSKVDMFGTRKFDSPKTMDVVEMKFNRGLLGRAFKTSSSTVTDALESLQDKMEEAMAFERTLAEKGEAILGPLCTGETFTITREMVSMRIVSKTFNEEKFVPAVIEPSFGIGRILTAVFEHSYYAREADEKRGVMAFKPLVAPIKVSILPLSSTTMFDPFVQELEELFKQDNLSTKTDTSSVAIGRKYARADELGIPFNVTIDFDTVTTKTVTLRERDSCAQIRLPISVVAREVKLLCSEFKKWSDLLQTYPIVASCSDDIDANSIASSSKEATVVEKTNRGSFRRPNGDVATAISQVTPAVSVVKKDKAPEPSTSSSSTNPKASVEEISACEERIVAQGDKIRVLKDEKKTKEELQPEIDALLVLKKEYLQLSGVEYMAPNKGSSKKDKKKKV